MAESSLRVVSSDTAKRSPEPNVPLGRRLVDRGAITPEQLVKGLHLQVSLNAPLGEILVAEGWTDPATVEAVVAEQHGLARADLDFARPDESLVTRMSHRFWLRHRALAWGRYGDTVLIATARPDLYEEIRPALDDVFGHTVPVIAPARQIERAIGAAFSQELILAAETRVEPRLSSRTWSGWVRAVPPLVIALTGGLAATWPGAAALGLCAAAMLTLVLFTLLRGSAFLSHLLRRDATEATPVREARVKRPGLPSVSVLVPLFRESEIADALVRRLSRLTYPKALLEVILVLEERDTVTRAALEGARLPHWIRVVEVPWSGRITTKPRAMNYALDFCRGEIIGVWDAEDAPAHDQIERVVARFAEAPEDVVCLQGVLDYYNPRTSWLSRCFALEYASWFRVILPGIARMGMVVPLGGTTLFFRRDKLEEVGGWDAYNVTEDADLGMRLCRDGYRTEMVDTVTYEEANFRILPWVRQRSRWLKGFMATYAVHMREPRRLWRELGPKRFFSLQAFFVGTVGQFLLAPALWSFWLVLFGVSHPAAALVPHEAILAVALVLFATELLGFTVALVAAAQSGRRYLMVWAVTLPFYYIFACFAAYKALIELTVAPYYWDKTQHGQAGPEAGHGAT